LTLNELKLGTGCCLVNDLGQLNIFIW